MIRKQFNIYFLMGALLVGLAVPSCKKIDDFGNTNQNPGATTSPVTSALLTNVLSTVAAYTWDAGGITTISGLYCQYFSETQYTDISIYNTEKPNRDFYYAPYGNSYTSSGALYSLKKIIDFNTDPKTATVAAANGSNANQIATARILKAYIFSMITDSYGDIPYSKALQG